jgi:hypothetical protein
MLCDVLSLEHEIELELVPSQNRTDVNVWYRIYQKVVGTVGALVQMVSFIYANGIRVFLLLETHRNGDE